MSNASCTIIVPTYNRNDLLRFGLQSMRRQNIDSRIIVINDYLPDESERLAREFNAECHFTGHRNYRNVTWRSPVFTLNLGIKKATSDIVVLSCAEMFLPAHDTLANMLEAIELDPMAMAIVAGFDDNGSFLNSLKEGREYDYTQLPALRTELPFFMAVRREHLLSIGGYDEDFTGQGYDDDDVVWRLQKLGCHYKRVSGHVVHLYHSRRLSTRCVERVALNRGLYESRKDILVRNLERKWGNG